jgi:hypothetical protein
MGTQLKNNDWIKTGQDGYLAILFLDDKSQLKIKGNSEIEVLAAVERGKISKTISLDYGEVKASVNKQKGDFRIATPTSVASVKGTEWWVISGADGDLFFVLEGTVEVENLISGETQSVPADYTASSNPDGTMGVNPTEDEDIPDDPDEGEEGEEEPVIHELRIEMRNTSGETKTLIIEYSE